MSKSRCPKCPNCGTQMEPDYNVLCKCPECKATYIPGDVTGVFVPLSIIGIH